MKTFLSALSVGLALMVMGTSASAAPFSYRFESQIVDSPFGAFGDPASITVTLDNGGTSDRSQVWTAANLQSVIFDINNGAAVASFFSPFDGGLAQGTGNFATDALGNLISAPSSWLDTSISADFTANFFFLNRLVWFINDFDVVLISGGPRNPTLLLELANGDGITDPANWSRVTALSLPPTLLLLLVGLGGVALLRRAHPGSASRPTFLSTAALPAVIR